MIYRAAESDTAKLLSYPETGMGYQVFEANMPGETSPRQFIAYNAEYIVDINGRERLAEYRSEKFNKSVSFAFLKEAQLFPAPTASIRPVAGNLLVEKRVIGHAKATAKHRHKGIAAKDSPKGPANGKEFFVRLSAFENDRRIDFVNRCLLPGAFATTLDDYRECLSIEDDPVDRYALPKDDVVEWAFYVQPKAGDSLRRGVVQPANNHDGGGIEALFDEGTAAGTLIDKRKYGQ